MSITALANQPQRSHDSITLGWGLVTIPLSVYSGTEATRVDRKEFYQDTNVAVGRSPIRKDTGAVIEQADVVRKAQATNGVWVTLSDDEIAACTSPKGLAQVERFVPLNTLNQYSAENVIQVRPKRDKGKPNVAADRAFALLLAAMDKRKVGALVKVAMRGPARYAILTPHGYLILIRSSDAVREPRDLPAYKPSKDELTMALSLIDNLGVDDNSVLRDDTAVAVQRYVDAKAKGIKPPTTPTSPPPTGDLMSALMASVVATAEAKKAKGGKAA